MTEGTLFRSATAIQGFLSNVTAVVISYNEEQNIRRCLEALRSLPSVVVLDSGSTDGTLGIAHEFSNVQVVTRAFDSFAGQWNYILNAGIVSTEWVLTMDADYIVTEGLRLEMSGLSPDTSVGGYCIGFTYCIHGKPLSGTLYPPRTALHRLAGARYYQDGHCQRVEVSGRELSLTHRFLHDDRKPLSRWLHSQLRYSEEEALRLYSKPSAELRLVDRVRRMVWIAPWLVPAYCLIAKRGVFDGWPGFYYALQRGIAEALIAIKIIESRWMSPRK